MEKAEGTNKISCEAGKHKRKKALLRGLQVQARCSAVFVIELVQNSFLLKGRSLPNKLILQIFRALHVKLSRGV